jgi:hypothetical protein
MPETGFSSEFEKLAVQKIPWMWQPVFVDMFEKRSA